VTGDGIARVLRLGLAWLLTIGLAGCGPVEAPSSGRSPGGDPTRGGTLVVAVLADVDSWNPYTTQDATSASIVDLLYPRLVHETGTGFEPWLAASWEFSPDRLSLTFHLEPRAAWGDGRPVTCDDVRFTYRAQLSEGLAWSGVFIKQRITSVDCPDDHTAVFHFAEAYPDQLIDVNDNAIVPVAYGEVPFREWAATKWEDRIVSSGPFRLVAVRPGQEAVLERAPSWWRKRGPWVDRIVFRVYPEATGAVPRFLEGEVDLITHVPAWRAKEVRERTDLRLVELPSLSYTFLGWNVLEPGAYVADRRRRGCGADKPCREDRNDIARLQREYAHPVLADARVRTALTLAIDREDIVDGLWQGHARVGSSPIVSALWAHDPATALPLDPEGAASLLDAAGWRDTDGDGVRERDDRPLRLGVIVNSENRLRRDALDRVVASLSAVGVRIVPEPLPRSEFVARVRNKSFDGVLLGWVAGTRIQPQTHLHTDAAVNRGNNFTAWSTAASDELLDRAAAASDRETARPLWHAWQAIYRREQPVTILYEERRLLGLSGRVFGPPPPLLDPLQNVHEWWLAPSAGGRG
jgi:peptide/nickel transport system substrate-binding protein